MNVVAQDYEEVIVKCQVVRRTKNALGIDPEPDTFYPETELVWLPLSQIEIVDVINDVECEISIPRWLAEEKEIV